jgi:BRCA1-associated protein
MLMNSITDETQGPATATFIPNEEIKSGGTVLSEGIIHLFRSNASASNTQDDFEKGTVLAILAIPSWMTVADFLTFISPALEGIEHLRIVRYVCHDLLETVLTGL